MSTENKNNGVITADEDLPMEMSCKGPADSDMTSVHADPPDNFDDALKHDMVIDSNDDTVTVVTENVLKDCDTLPDISYSAKLPAMGRCGSLEDIHCNSGGKMELVKRNNKPETILVFSCSVPANMTAMEVSDMSVSLYSTLKTFKFE